MLFVPNFSVTVINPATSHKQGAVLESMQHYTGSPVAKPDTVFFIRLLLSQIKLYSRILMSPETERDAFREKSR